MPPHSNARGPQIRKEAASLLYRSNSIDVSCSSRSKLIFSKLMRSRPSRSGGASLKSESIPSKQNPELAVATSEQPNCPMQRECISGDDMEEAKQFLGQLHRQIGGGSSSARSLQRDARVETEVKVRMSRLGVGLQNYDRASSLRTIMLNDSDNIQSTELVDSLENQGCSLEGNALEGQLAPAVCEKSNHSDHEVEIKVQTLNELQKIVTQLQFGGMEEQWVAADKVRRLTKDDPPTRTTLAMLGVIPPLILMLDSGKSKIQSTALLALLNLAIGNEINKAGIVKARAIPKMVKLLQSPHVAVQEAVVTAFLSLSALDANKAEIGLSGAIPILTNLLHNGTKQSRKDALRALYNLSIHPGNVEPITEAGTVAELLTITEEEEMGEKALATLSNLATTERGRKAIAKEKEAAYGVLIGALRWMDAAKCQERAAYILMMLATHSKTQRREMAREGAIGALLEVALMGTEVAQRRAARTLASLRRTSTTFAADCVVPAEVPTVGVAQKRSRRHPPTEKKVVDGLVRHSLRLNMQRIAHRAHLHPPWTSPSSAVTLPSELSVNP